MYIPYLDEDFKKKLFFKGQLKILHKIFGDFLYNSSKKSSYYGNFCAIQYSKSIRGSSHNS